MWPTLLFIELHQVASQGVDVKLPTGRLFSIYSTEHSICLACGRCSMCRMTKTIMIR